MTRDIFNKSDLRLSNKLNDIEEICTISHLQDVNTDLILTLCGKKLGTGVYRATYDYNLDSKYVIKIEPRSTHCNIEEYLLWDEIRGLRGSLAWVKDWFAPIKYISPNGKVLVMEKTYKKEGKPKPEKIPTFLWDVKDANFGWIGNKYVCHDYANIHSFINYRKSFKNVVW